MGQPGGDTAARSERPGQRARIDDPFDVDSPVAADLRQVDWAATPLGEIATWPQSLQTAVRTVLTSRFSMWMAWGPELTFFCNDAYRRDTLGKKYPWALGRPAREVWAEIWGDIGPRIDAVLTTGTATWDEALMLFLERSGYVEETYHTFSYSPLADESGEVVGMLCVVSEETERVIAERQMALLRDLSAETATIRAEPEFFAVVGTVLGRDQRSLPFTATYVFDDDQSVARLACASGTSPGSAVSPTVLRLGDDSAAWPAAALLEGEPAVVGRLSERFADLPLGAWPDPPLQALLVPIRQQGNDAPIGFLVVGLNRYRPLDEAYRSFIDLIAGQIGAGVSSARAYEAERRRADALAELDRAKTDFFTNISHEFRTPLTLLLGPAEDALNDIESPLTGRHRDRVEIIHRNGQRLLRLVNNLLDFSRLESGRLSARFEPVDLAQETADLASAFRSAVERVGLSLTVTADPLPEPVYVDREMWAKVVLNLLSNALKFTFDGGIDVSVSAAGDAAVVAVADTGVGVEPEQLPKLFERFQRIAGTRSRTHEGSGIGLALVAELVDLHGGTVSVDSTPGVGTRFEIRVPLGHAHLPPEQVADAATGLLDPHAAAQGFLAEADRWLSRTEPDTPADAPADRPRLLVVDDNADMRDYITRLLQGEYAILAAADGVEALEITHRERPDLVLTDVMMPRMDGFELLTRLRDDAVTAEIPVVMLSARAGDEATVDGLEAGADDYLVKPFTARELRARVRANLELERVRRNRAQLEHSRLLLNEAQRLAQVGSWEVDLATGSVTGSPEFFRLLGLTEADFERMPFPETVRRLVVPEDRDQVEAAFAAAADGARLAHEARAVVNGSVRRFHVLGEREVDERGVAVRLRGSFQDVTEQHAAQEAMAATAAAQEAAEREHRIAEELQRSLMPAPDFSSDHLEVSSYYRAGVEGTYVGGDWFDVIQLGAGRTALVIGDVMGRGVPAAAVMGQLRAAVRAYAWLDLTPTDILEFLDAVVRDLGDDHIVTCVYAVYDPTEQKLTYASAGHLPGLLLLPGAKVRRLTQAGPPLGTGVVNLREDTVAMPDGTMLALYTDGLVETRDRDLDEGIEMLARRLARTAGRAADVPRAIVEQMLPAEPDDDVALLIATVDSRGAARTLVIEPPPDEQAVHAARDSVARALSESNVPQERADDIVLLASELVTNAIVHGKPPLEVRLQVTGTAAILDVRDHATYLPRRLRPSVNDEHGRGLQLVSLLADRWGTRPVKDGKSVWCEFFLA